MDDAQKGRSARIVNATSASILKAAGDAMSGYDGPDGGAPCSRTLYEMLKSHVAPGATP